MTDHRIHDADPNKAREESKIGNVEQLAIALARRSRVLSRLLLAMLDRERAAPGAFHAFYTDVQEELKHGFTPEEFADFFAQTLVFGYLFSWFNCKKAGLAFSLDAARESIARSQESASKIFRAITEPWFDAYAREMRWVLDDLAWIFGIADHAAIQAEIAGSIGEHQNPLIYFYEDFLRIVDPKLKRQGGVYYTPVPVVDFMIRGVESLLKTRFGKDDGFYSPGLRVLDPAAGTGTFFCQIVLRIHQELAKAGRVAEFDGIMNDRVIPNLFAFELLPSAHAIGIYNFLALLGKLGAREGIKPNFFLTNTLDVKDGIEPATRQTVPGVLATRANQATAGGQVLAIVGNPPYAPVSANRSPFIEALLDSYREAVKYEKKKSGLTDDYIKFFRFAQHQIEQNGSGIVAFITNASFLKGVIHAGMRDEMMRCFDEIFIVHLHGSTRPPEELPAGLTQNGNVLDIQVGACITFLIKHSRRVNDVIVKYADAWGTKEEKFTFLSEHSLDSIEWRTLYAGRPPVDRNFFLALQRTDASYSMGIPATILFKHYSTGVQMRQDIRIKLPNPDARTVQDGIFSFTRGDGDMQRFELAPFCGGYVAFPPSREQRAAVFHRDRGTFFDVMLQDEHPEALVLMRRATRKLDRWKHFFVVSGIIERFFVDYDNNYAFPLRFNGKPNVRAEVTDFLETAYGTSIDPCEVFDYVLGLLSSSFFTIKYEDFAMFGFASIVFPSSPGMFHRLAGFGHQARQAFHVQVSPKPGLFQHGSTPRARYRVDKIDRDAPAGVVRINDDVSINITNAEWDFFIGTRYPIQEWLQYRMKLAPDLDRDAMDELARIVAAIDALIDIERDIDAGMPTMDFPVLDSTPCVQAVVRRAVQDVLYREYHKGNDKLVPIEKIRKGVHHAVRVNPVDHEAVITSTLKSIASRIDICTNGILVECYMPKTIVTGTGAGIEAAIDEGEDEQS